MSGWYTGPNHEEREAADAGARLLDEKRPGWWRDDAEPALDLDTLDVAQCGRCVIGQIGWPHIEEELERSFDEDDLVAATLPVEPLGMRTRAAVAYDAGLHLIGLRRDQADRYGFEDRRNVSYRGLTESWIDIITARRQYLALVKLGRDCDVDEAAGVVVEVGALADYLQMPPRTRMSVIDRCVEVMTVAATARRSTR